MIDLSKNENLFPAPSRVQTLSGQLQSIELYVRRSDFLEELASYVQLPTSFIRINYGAEEVLIEQIQSILQISSNRNVLLPERSWPFYYPYLEDAKGQITHFPNNFEAYYNPQIILEHILEYDIDLCILCSPNNPTSTLMTYEDLDRLLEQVPPSVTILLDETYWGFTPEVHTGFELTQKHQNLVIVQSFSKFFGLAGVRIGFSVSNPELQKQLQLPRRMLGMSIFTECYGLAALASFDYYRNCALQLVEARDSFIKKLNSFPFFTAHHSNTNFITVKVHPDYIETAKAQFDLQGLKIFQYPEEIYKNILRFTLGPAMINQKIEEVIKYFAKHQSHPVHAEYHIHINTIGKKLDSETKSKITDLGFRYKSATILFNQENWQTLGRPKEYLGLYTINLQTSNMRDHVFSQSLEILGQSDSFHGYIESESIADNLVEEFDYQVFQNKQAFPLRTLSMVSEDKVADIHVYRPFEANEDELHDLLLNNHFYEVQTSKKRIYTIELESMASAKSMYHQLYNYFKACGGIIEIECEVVKSLEFSSDDFTFRPVVSKSFI